MVQDSCPKVFSLLFSLPQKVTGTMALLGVGEEARDCLEWGSKPSV